MKDKLLWLMLFSMTFVNARAQNDSIAPSLNDSSLIVYLRANYYPTNPRGYDAARDSMYQYLDVDASDSLTCVYSGLRAKRDGTRSPSNNGMVFNTEHTWPQSFYDEAEPMRGDIHHLFPSWSSPNQSRSNHPFGEIEDVNTTSWWYYANGGSVSSIPSTHLDEYSEYYNSTFEPREDHKGNVARAVFYFWTMYRTNNDIVTDTQDNEAFFEGMKQTLYAWHKADPVDAKEISRSNGIESIQGNKNPFIHDTSLVRRAYFYSGSGTNNGSSGNSDLFISEVYEANGGTVKYLELFNDSDSTIDLSAGDWQLWRFSNENTTYSSISLSGQIAAKDFWVVGDDNATSGVQTIFGSDLVDVNTSAVNHNGNDKYLLVRNATSSPDTVDSFGIDNIGNSGSFSDNQVAYRLYSALPNNGAFGQSMKSASGDTVSSGNWVVYDITSDNANGKMVATPGFSKGIESSKRTEALLTGVEGWRLISIPGNNATLNEIADDIAIQGIGNSNDSNVFTYDENGSYSTPAALSSSIPNGTGLSVYLFDNNLLGSNELPNSLDISINEPGADVILDLNTTTAESGSYFTLAGNPYQSNYALSALSLNGAVQSNIHVLKNGLYEPVSTSGAILLPWQGFWVETPTTGSATELTFSTSGKTNDDATVAAYNKIIAGPSHLSLKLRSADGLDFGCSIMFSAGSKIGFDQNDATKLKPAKNEYAIAGCIGEDRIQSIFSLPMEIDKVIEVPLFIENTLNSDQLLFEWESEIHDGLSAQLIDTFRGTSINLDKKGALDFEFESTKSNKELELKTGIVLPNSKQKSNSERFIIRILPTGITNSETNETASAFGLFQNYPNPFNPETTIKFELSQSGNVKLEVYSVQGKLVTTMVNGTINAGIHTVSWDAKNQSSGIYFARLISQEGIRTIKMVVLK
tara:strand:+ start:90573 stop:93326 length:2754 start_codon:yes stop_codon:yes gene_type:complete